METTKKAYPLGRAARATLAEYGVTAREWAAANFPDGVWFGDRCGCPDDRCAGYHHERGGACTCLVTLLDSGRGWL